MKEEMICLIWTNDEIVWRIVERYLVEVMNNSTRRKWLA